MKKTGFTLAELLIGVAIIATLVAISIPIFVNKAEQARNAVDMTVMRQAKTIVSLEIMLNNSIVTDGYTRYYYTPGASELSTERPNFGYGKSRTNAQKWWHYRDEATGIPCINNRPTVLALTIDSDYKIHYYWGGAYTGLNTTNQMEYQALTQEQKIDKDKILLDSLQGEFRNMTYAQLRNLFLNEDGSRKSNLTYGVLNGNLCVTIAYSKISNSGIVDTSRDTNNIIYFSDIFNNAGFNTELNTDQTYIINSVPNNQQTIWINLNIKENDLRNLTSAQANSYASKSYTYLKSGGASTPLVLQEAYRKFT